VPGAVDRRRVVVGFVILGVRYGVALHLPALTGSADLVPADRKISRVLLREGTEPKGSVLSR
jgi:hypothetical protein